MTLNAKKHTIGVRLPDHKIVQAIVAELGEPLLASSLILPGQEEPLSEGWVVDEEIGHAIDVIVDGPIGAEGATTVLNLVKRKISRLGAGDVSGVEL